MIQSHLSSTQEVGGMGGSSYPKYNTDITGFLLLAEF